MVEAQSLLVALAKSRVMASDVPSKFDGQQEAFRFALAQGFEPVDPIVVHPTDLTPSNISG